MNAVELLEKSKAVSLALPLQEEPRDVQSALILMCGLKKLGKQVSLDRPQSPLHSSSLEEKIFIVSLKGLAPWITKVRYEKDMKDLKLYFTLNQGKISPEALSLHVQNQADLIIIVGNKFLEDNNTKLPSATVLQENQARQALFNLLSSKQGPHTRILGLILSKLTHVARLNLYTAVLSHEDFRAIRQSPKALPLSLPTLQESFGSQSSFLFLLDTPFGSQGILWSPSRKLQAKFRDIAGGQQKGSWTLLRTTPLSSDQIKHAFLT